jgi:hypothetical protein
MKEERVSQSTLKGMRVKSIDVLKRCQRGAAEPRVKKHARAGFGTLGLRVRAGKPCKGDARTCTAPTGLAPIGILTQGSGLLRSLHPGLCCSAPAALKIIPHKREL